jgi:hypothetical protein
MISSENYALGILYQNSYFSLMENMKILPHDDKLICDKLYQIIPLKNIGHTHDGDYFSATIKIVSILPLNKISTWKYMFENNLPKYEICEYAALTDNFELLKWAHKNECPWGESVCFWAAENDNFEMLKWAHEHGCQLDEEVCICAAQNNNFEMLKWAHENGCPWDKNVCVCAAQNNNFEMLKWAHESQDRCPLGEYKCSTKPMEF